MSEKGLGLHVSSLMKNAAKKVDSKFTVAVAVLQQDKDERFYLHLDNGTTLSFKLETKKKTFVEMVDSICDAIMDFFPELKEGGRKIHKV